MHDIIRFAQKMSFKIRQGDIWPINKIDKSSLVQFVTCLCHLLDIIKRYKIESVFKCLLETF